MSTTPKSPMPADQLLQAIAVFSTEQCPVTDFFDLDAHECATLVSHFRAQANTLASTQAELELCRKTVTEQAKDSADNYAECERLSAELTVERAAHLATRRALDAINSAESFAAVVRIRMEYFPEFAAARAEVAKADQPKTCGECAKLNSVPCELGHDQPRHAEICSCFQPRADAQKGGSM